MKGVGGLLPPLAQLKKGGPRGAVPPGLILRKGGSGAPLGVAIPPDPLPEDERRGFSEASLIVNGDREGYLFSALAM